MIIDVHGHYTTAPKALEDWRNRQIAAIERSLGRCPKASELKISDDELRESDRSATSSRRCRSAAATSRSSRRAPASWRTTSATSRCRRPGPRSATSCAPRRQAFPGQLHRRGDAAAVAGRRSEDLHPRAGAVRQGIRLRRHQPQSRPVRRPLDLAAAVGPALVSALREDGGARRPRDDPRLAPAATPASTPRARITSTPTRRPSCSA